MRVPILNSITSLNPEDVYRTRGSLPILVHCNDLKYYVVKYKRGKNDHSLVREFLSAAFLKIWGLGVPDFAIVTITLEHIPPDLHSDIQPYYFQYSCFGSKFGRYYDEVTQLLERMPNYQKRLFVRKIEFPEIALFDIWVGNEDRNANNYNLLYDLRNSFRFVPIDHQAIFNYGMPGGKLSLLTENETIISSPIFQKLFTKKEMIDFGRKNQVKNKFYICVEKCHRDINQIIALLPEDWGIDKKQWSANLDRTIFQDKWLKEVWNTFLEYLQIAINNKK